MQYLPAIQKEINKIPRGFLANTIYSVCGEPFQVWVRGVMAERNRRVAAERNLLIDMDPDLV